MKLPGKKTKALVAFLAGLGVFAGVSVSGAQAAESAVELKEVEWQFDGPFGTVDRQSAQRGLQVYREVCAGCHGLTRVAFRTLTELGLTEAEVKALASEYYITDGPNDEGEMYERPGIPADKFPSPYPNEQAARSVNGGAYPPDLSLIVKARPDGANYLYSLLTGYEEAPEGFEMRQGLHYNKYYPGHKIAMAAPLVMEGQVQYGDETTATVDQMSKDVVNFLQWTSEPEMEARKQMGLKVLLFLIILTGFFYVAKKKIWKDIEGEK
jgi:ubiquinol-cytochrome c reductase cytochrome c1 subunit